MQSFIELLQEFWTSLQQGQLPELGPWNYLLLAVLIFWQGPAATLLGGAAAAAGLLKPSLVFFVGIATNLTADIVWYSIGRRGNVDRLFESGRWKGHRNRFVGFRSAMNRHATKVLLLAKLSSGLAVPAIMAAGVSKISWRRWFPVVFIGETIWTGTLLLIGYFATEALKRVEHGLQFFTIGITFVFLILSFWFVPRIIRHSDALNAPSSEENKTS